jgi:coronin-7
LGPKPFTPPKLNEPESFDKVFCVPAVPGQQVQQSNGVHEPKTPVSETSPAVEEICQEKEVVENDDDPKSESETVKSETVEENESSAVSGHAPKTPSTAERRKMFESNTKENEPEDNFDVIDQSGTFERASVQRSSIAERRKMYENRSQSVQETPTVIIEKGGRVACHVEAKGFVQEPKERGGRLERRQQQEERTGLEAAVFGSSSGEEGGQFRGAHP